ncbi:MAG: hypothetical protein KAK04_24175, partial [Cyclobacteriaceae bacterium]|nr:hypothetical protein [Cyclobacteriaceae bacterium]
MKEKKNTNGSSVKDQSKSNLSRRSFVAKSAGVIAASSVLGASVIPSEALAQDNKFGTPDWRTLKPGVKDTAMYTEETGFDENNSDVTWWAGRNVSGVTIGLCQIRANLHMMPGNMGNASTFDFPMLYREMNVNNAMDVMV